MKRVDLPTYDDFVNQEGPAVDAAVFASTRRRPTSSDVAHWGWRRLRENWDQANIMRHIAGQPTTEDLQPDSLDHVFVAWPTYEQLMAFVPAISATVRERNQGQHGPSTGDMRHNVWRLLVEGWELEDLLLDIAGKVNRGARGPERPYGPGSGQAEFPERQGPAARTGLVRTDGRVFVDDGGAFLGVGVTLFWLAWGFRHDRDRLTENLVWLAERGVHYVRALGVVGPGGWIDRTVDPTWPDYQAVIEGATDLAAACGLRVQWTIFGGTDTTPTPDSRRRVVEAFIDLARTRADQILAFEVANEGWQNGFDGDDGAAEAKQLAGLLRDGTPNLVAVTAPNEGQEGATAYYDGSRATLLTLHLDRDVRGTGGIWRPVRQAWEAQFLADVPKAWTNNEPIGPQSSVEEDANPLRLTMAAVLTWLCGGAGYVLHTGAGVRGGGIEDLQRGRPANMWDNPNMDAILSGIAAARSVLPADLPNWRRFNTSAHDSNEREYPFDLAALRTAIEDGRLLRAFCAKQGDRFVIAPIRIRGEVPFRAKGSMDLDVIDPLTGFPVLTDVQQDQGTVLVLKEDGGLPNADGAAGILIGVTR